MDCEQLATSAIIQAVSGTDKLKAFINSGDKEPSFDGYIYIYSNNNYSKYNIKRVSVQIKGKVTKSKIKSTIKYPITVSDLKNYLSNGGVMFFVVYIDDTTKHVKQIYYSSLLPFKIKEILNEKKNNTNSISVKLKAFPDKKNQITDLFLNFYSDAQKQISFADREIPSIEDLQKQGILESLTISYISTDAKKEASSYPKLFNGKEIYLYANLKGGVASIPVKYFEQISDIQLSCNKDISVGVKGVIYYDNITKTITADKEIYQIGSSITISHLNKANTLDDDDNSKAIISIQLKGSLIQRIKSLQLIVAMIHEKSIELDGVPLPISFNEPELNKDDLNFYKDILNNYQQALSVLKKLNVRDEIDIDNFSKEDFLKLDILIEAIGKGNPIKNVKGTNTPIVKFVFGNIYLVLICEKRVDGSYNLWDYFNKHINVYFLDEKQESIPASQYSILKANDFLTVNNLNLQKVIDDFKQIEPSQLLAESGNEVMLEMLKAYDQSQNAELFLAIKQMSNWLKTLDGYLNSNAILINDLQIIRRERKLTYQEKEKLHQIVDSTDDISFKIGALILLDEQEEAKKHLSTMDPINKEKFTSYPIFRFYSNNKETNS